MRGQYPDHVTWILANERQYPGHVTWIVTNERPVSRSRNLSDQEGKLHELKNRWWKERRGGGQCDTKDKGRSDNANELTLDSVGGVFVVLIAGMGIACAISVMEFIWKGSSLEKKAKVKPSSLVAKALYNTNSNLFNVAGIQNQTQADSTACPHGRVTG